MGEQLTKSDVAKIKELNLDDYKDMQVPVGISNKHVHVCQADLDVLFGEGHELTPIKDLSQPGQTRIATSEDTPLARKNLDDFKKGKYRILVTVAMAYEGLNVPEVSVICCLSHIRSVPWLEQCFARANRLATGKKRAIVFAPADWSFKKAVKMIRNEELVPLSDGQENRHRLAADLSIAFHEHIAQKNIFVNPVCNKFLSQTAFQFGNIMYCASNLHAAPQWQ